MVWVFKFSTGFLCVFDRTILWYTVAVSKVHLWTFIVKNYGRTSSHLVRLKVKLILETLYMKNTCMIVISAIRIIINLLCLVFMRTVHRFHVIKSQTSRLPTGREVVIVDRGQLQQQKSCLCGADLVRLYLPFGDPQVRAQSKDLRGDNSTAFTFEESGLYHTVLWKVRLWKCVKWKMCSLAPAGCTTSKWGW